MFAVAFAGIATGADTAAINLAFTAAVVASCAWQTAVAVDLYGNPASRKRLRCETDPEPSAPLGLLGSGCARSLNS